MVVWMWVSNGFAAETCTRRALEPTTRAADASSLALERLSGALTLVASEDDQVRVTGTACGKVSFRLGRRDGVIVATARVPEGAAPEWTVAIPTGIRNITIHRHRGPIATQDRLDVDLAVVSSDGPLTVDHARSLRVAYGSGPVTVTDVPGALVVDQRAGALGGAAAAGRAPQPADQTGAAL